MIIDYDRNPRLNTDEKLLSLIDSIQRSFVEVTEELAEVRKEIEKIKEEEER